MLFGIERLPEEPASSTAAPAEAPSFAGMLFGAEALPLDPEPTLPPRPLRAPEILAEDPVTPDAPRRGGWLRWIFRPEKLEPHP